MTGLTARRHASGGAGGGLFGYQNHRDMMRTSFKLLKSATDCRHHDEDVPAGYRLGGFLPAPGLRQGGEVFHTSPSFPATPAATALAESLTPRPPPVELTSDGGGNVTNKLRAKISDPPPCNGYFPLNNAGNLFMFCMILTTVQCCHENSFLMNNKLN